MSLALINKTHVWHPFTQHQTASDPLIITSAQGASLFDSEGKEYVDLISSWWVNLHGHSHPKIVSALSRQAETLDHIMFAGFTHEPAIALARDLVALLPPPLSRVFFSDNGSTAVEVALKMALQYWHNKGGAKKHIVAFQGAYHGDTFGAMALGKSSGFYDPFSDHLFYVDFIEYPYTWDGDPDIEIKEEKALTQFNDLIRHKADQIAALIIEPLIQGVAGMRMCRPVFLDALIHQCRIHNILVIYDEVMTGFGRTGKLFACHHLCESPDFICLSKGITGGVLPLAVTITTEEIYQEFLGNHFHQSFAHGHSYTANPLGCAVARASLALFEEEKTFKKIEELEKIHQERMTRFQEKGQVSRVRVLGGVAAMDFSEEGVCYGSLSSQQLRHAFLEKGLNVRPLGTVIYLMPPYCLTPCQLHDAYDRIEDVLWSFTRHLS